LNRLNPVKYRSRQLQQARTRDEMVGSTGQVGSTATTLRRNRPSCSCNVLDHRRWGVRDGLRIAIVAWIERTHHRRRRQPTPTTAA
jgi:hypothetical protein